MNNSKSKWVVTCERSDLIPMCAIKSVFLLVILAFRFANGYQCEKKIETHMGCPIYKIEAENDCESYLETNGENDNFIFYINPLTRGHLNISLYKKHVDNSHIFIYENLFTVKINNANQWHKIKIRKEQEVKAHQNLHITYFLEVDDLQKAGISFIIPHVVGAGNEIRVKTVSSMWSMTCDPRLYKQSRFQPTRSLQLSIQAPNSVHLEDILSSEDKHNHPNQPIRSSQLHSKPTKNETISDLVSGKDIMSLLRNNDQAREYHPMDLPSNESLPQIQPHARFQPSTTSTISHLTSSTTSPTTIEHNSRKVLIPAQKVSQGFQVWQLAIVVAVTMVLTLIIILVSVFIFVRHQMKNIVKPPVQKKKLSARLSRQVSKILGYSTILDHNYDEVNLNSPDEEPIQPRYILEE